MAILAFNHFLRMQCFALPDFLLHIGSSLYPLSEHLYSNDYASDSILVSQHISHGFRNNHRYVLPGLRPCMGATGKLYCFGNVDHGRSILYLYLLRYPFHHVRARHMQMSFSVHPCFVDAIGFQQDDKTKQD